MSAYINSEIHYHILWSDSSLDWKPLSTEEEAATLARHIKKRNESYVIVERDAGCERCKRLKSQLPQDLGAKDLSSGRVTSR